MSNRQTRVWWNKMFRDLDQVVVIADNSIASSLNNGTLLSQTISLLSVALVDQAGRPRPRLRTLLIPSAEVLVSINTAMRLPPPHPQGVCRLVDLGWCPYLHLNDLFFRVLEDTILVELKKQHQGTQIQQVLSPWQAVLDAGWVEIFKICNVLFFF